VPAGAVVANLVDFAIAAVLLAALAGFAGIHLRPAILAFPIFAVALMMTTFSVGLLLSAINVRYRDVRFALPFLIQVWLFATPVVYPSSILSRQWRVVFGLNPISGLVEGMRWSVLGTPFPTLELVLSVAGSVALLAVGLAYFRRVEATFADVV
jgi:lipopolysaccharide transport system permease protein